MSNTMVIKVMAVEVGTAKSTKGKDYTFVEVTYKNRSFQDKPETKKHNQYGDQTVFKTLKEAQPGDVYTITREKDDNGYWQWIGIEAGEDTKAAAKEASATPETPAKANVSPRSTYETPEERAKRQVYIIRQSSASTAVEFLNHNKKSYTLDDLLTTAKFLENYVFGNVPGVQSAVKTETLPEFEDDDVPV